MLNPAFMQQARQQQAMQRQQMLQQQGPQPGLPPPQAFQQQPALIPQAQAMMQQQCQPFGGQGVLPPLPHLQQQRPAGLSFGGPNFMQPILQPRQFLQQRQTGPPFGGIPPLDPRAQIQQQQQQRPRRQARVDPVARRAREPRERRGEVQVPGYEFVKALGVGGMAEAVILVKSKRSDNLYIEKRVRIDGYHRGRSMAELTALQCMERGGHVNCLKEYKLNESIGSCSFILEYCDQGSLEGYMQRIFKARQQVPEKFAWQVLLGLARALAFMHTGVRDAEKEKPDKGWLPICHLDLKPCNVFLSSDGQRGGLPRVVLGDFGCAVGYKDIVFGMEHPNQQQCGTPDWYPPEGLPQVVGHGATEYGPATDVWQMGATVHALCRLYLSPDRSMLTSNATRSPCGRLYGERLNQMVKKCCSDGEQRPMAHQVVKEVSKIMRDKGFL